MTNGLARCRRWDSGIRATLDQPSDLRATALRRHDVRQWAAVIDVKLIGSAAQALRPPYFLMRVGLAESRPRNGAGGMYRNARKFGVEAGPRGA
jgi:hypothetical protein